MKRALLGAVVLVVTGCAELRPMTATSTDLADYRKVRLAATVPEHLVASQEYLAHHPDGAWAVDVRASYEREEAEYFAHAQTSRARAVEYLSYLPRGPHADAALATLRAFDGHIADDETSRLVAAAKRTTAELDARSAERKQIQEDLLAAIAAIVRAPLGVPLDRAPDLARALRGKGSGTWGDGLVRKEHYVYVLPIKNGSVDRDLEVTMEVRLREGVLVSAELRGVGLLSRLSELASTQPSGAAERAAALAYVEDVVRGATSGQTDPRTKVSVHQGDEGEVDWVRIEKTRE